MKNSKATRDTKLHVLTYESPPVGLHMCKFWQRRRKQAVIGWR